MRHHVAAIWLSLIACGALRPEDVPDRAAHHDVLRDVGRGLPGVVEMRYRHHVEPEDAFRMREGFTNFDSVDRGEVLAFDSGGEIRSEEAGFVLLPLYQGQGQDGFFIGRFHDRTVKRACSMEVSITACRTS